MDPEFSDVIAMTRRFTMQSLTTRRLKSSKPPSALVAALIMLATFVTIAAPGTAFGLRRVDRRHRILRHLRGILWNPMFRPPRDSLISQKPESNRTDQPRIHEHSEHEALQSDAALV